MWLIALLGCDFSGAADPTAVKGAPGGYLDSNMRPAPATRARATMPPALEILNLGEGIFNDSKFTGSIPAEWGSLTNLKELKMVCCGLSGA